MTISINPAINAIVCSLEETWSSRPEKINSGRNAGRVWVKKVQPPDGFVLRLPDNTEWNVMAYQTRVE